MFSVKFINLFIFFQIVSYLNKTEAFSLAKMNNEMMISSGETEVDSTGDFVENAEFDMNEQFEDNKSSRIMKEQTSNEILKRSDNTKNLLSWYCRMKMSRCFMNLPQSFIQNLRRSLKNG